MKRLPLHTINDITFEYISRVRFHDDELGSIIKGHLLIEYIVNKIIEQKCRQPKKILADTRSYPFSVRLQILASMDLVPDYLYKNIHRVNKMRNQLAHNLEIDIETSDFGFTTAEGKNVSLKGLRSRRNPAKEYAKHLCMGTLTQLRNQYFHLFGVFPQYPS